MEFEIRTESTVYKSDRVYGATTGTPILLPTLTSGKRSQFQVRTVWVECCRDGEHQPWYVYSIHATGPVIKKNGEPGLLDRGYTWGRTHPTRPEWVAKLADEFLAELEQERTAGTRIEL